MSEPRAPYAVSLPPGRHEPGDHCPLCGREAVRELQDPDPYECACESCGGAWTISELDAFRFRTRED